MLEGCIEFVDCWSLGALISALLDVILALFVWFIYKFSCLILFCVSLHSQNVKIAPFDDWVLWRNI